MLLPTDGAAIAWDRAGKAKVYGPGDLYNYIDGGAELFLEFGFQACTVQQYQRGKDEIVLEVYRMDDPVAARGIYLMKCGVEKPDPAFKERHTADKFQVTFQRNRYFVVVNAFSGEGLQSAMVELAARLAARLPVDMPVVELKQLPAEGLLPGSARLLRGQYALASVFTLGEGNILGLGNKQVGGAGRYRIDAKTDYSLIRVNYPDDLAARRAYQFLLKNLDSYLKIVRKELAAVVFKDYANQFGQIRLAGRTLWIKVRLPKEPK